MCRSCVSEAAGRQSWAKEKKDLLLTWNSFFKGAQENVAPLTSDQQTTEGPTLPKLGLMHWRTTKAWTTRAHPKRWGNRTSFSLFYFYYFMVARMPRPVFNFSPVLVEPSSSPPLVTEDFAVATCSPVLKVLISNLKKWCFTLLSEVLCLWPRVAPNWSSG